MSYRDSGVSPESGSTDSVIGFPNPVNEKAARVVAGFVATIAIVALATGWYFLLPVLAVGFWLRVATGPSLSPLGQLATRVIAPRLGPPREVPGPPKRFAQTIGAVLTTLGSVLAFIFGLGIAAPIVLAMLAAFAVLESVFGICVGCHMFNLLMRLGLIPAEVCEACNDLSLRRA
ncbi:MAG: DUF4395 domain-containing protein [Solirubrobacterales bacterium]|nr:DUF4395 domain-containing protein [Solirubrobacterales bacterium]